MTKKNTSKQESLSIRLFVYGTLKRGYWNFERYCRNAVDIQPAKVWGRLWQLPAGYPAIEVPQNSILAHGTGDPVADARTQQHFPNRKQLSQKPDGDWDLVQGEMMTLLDPERELPPIDRLEGFRAGGQSLYQRSMIPAKLQMKVVPVWGYTMENQHGTRLHDGIWTS